MSKRVVIIMIVGLSAATLTAAGLWGRLNAQPGPVTEQVSAVECAKCGEQCACESCTCEKCVCENCKCDDCACGKACCRDGKCQAGRCDTGSASKAGCGKSGGCARR